MTPAATAPPAAPARRFTPEQRAAVADRDGSSLLAAGAGSGKTAVMVERFVEAVRLDGVAVGAILALTFTEKAAAELRERIRRRFTELGEDEHARAVDAAWIGTIHGFCARVLRAHPLAAGLDPRFAVLDEGAAPARRRGRVRDGARGLDGGARRGGGGRRGRLQPRPRGHGHERPRHAAQPRRKPAAPGAPAAAAGPRPGRPARRGGGRGRGDPRPRRRTARGSPPRSPPSRRSTA